MCGGREIAIDFEMRVWIRVMVTEIEKKSKYQRQFGEKVTKL